MYDSAKAALLVGNQKLDYKPSQRIGKECLGVHPGIVL
jgi:hypothetical protein